MTLSPAQQAEFDCRGLLRLPGAIPGPDTDAMRDGLWRYLRETQGVAAERPQTWAVGTPAHFQALVRTGAFDAMATAQVRDTVDALLVRQGWEPPAHWGRPLVTFPQPRVPWRLPLSGWHMDSSGRAGDPLLVVFACLSPVRSRGGGTIVVTGSHRLTRVGSRYAGLRSADVRVRLADNHPWFHYLLTRSDEPDRTERLLSSGSIVEEVEVRIEELTGDTGDTFIMDPRLLHAVAPNSRDTPRLMLLQFIQGRRSGDRGLPPRAMSDQTAVAGRT